MTDARIVATNPADSSVVAVACNENGELLLADSSLTQFVKKAGDKMEGSLEVTEKIKLGSDGSAYFSGQGVTFDADGCGNDASGEYSVSDLYSQTVISEKKLVEVLANDLSEKIIQLLSERLNDF